MSEWKETIEAIRLFSPWRVLYWRFIYRHHMRFIHRRGGHEMRHFGPIWPDGSQFDRCEWCGHVENFTAAIPKEPT